MSRPRQVVCDGKATRKAGRRLLYALYLAVAAVILLELALRAWFAFEAGPRVLAYGTPSPRPRPTASGRCWWRRAWNSISMALKEIVRVAKPRALLYITPVDVPRAEFESLLAPFERIRIRDLSRVSDEEDAVSRLDLASNLIPPSRA